MANATISVINYEKKKLSFSWIQATHLSIEAQTKRKLISLLVSRWLLSTYFPLFKKSFKIGNEI
jgi:hypothetical protein